MQCHNCNNTIAIWHSYCPHCQQRVQNVTYSTISDTPKETLEDHSRRKLLRTILQFVLFAVAVIVVATAIRLSLTKPVIVRKEPTNLPTAQPPAQAAETANHSTVSDPISAPTPETVPTRKPIVTEQQLASERPIHIFSAEDLARISEPTQVVRQPQTTKIEPVAKQSALAMPQRLPLVKVDEALPKNLAKITKETSAPPRPVAPLQPIEPSLEVETGNVSLNPNTGLLSIKSYVPARIYIDGVFSGITPRSVKLLAGEHVVTLLADGYQEYARKLKVNGKQQMGILASMSKK